MAWSDKVRQLKLKARESWFSSSRRLKCTKCGVIMKDIEPMLVQGEFNHPNNGCKNSNTTWDYDPKLSGWGKGRVHGIVQYLPKKYERARRRGAKRASKHRGSW